MYLAVTLGLDKSNWMKTEEYCSASEFEKNIRISSEKEKQNRSKKDTSTVHVYCCPNYVF